jgi:hypothetical protein
MSPSPSLYLPLDSNHVSKLKQQSNGRPMRKEHVLPKIAMSSPTGTEEPHKRTFTVCSTIAPTF